MSSIETVNRVSISQAPPPGKLGLVALYCLSIGQVIGAGVITLVGPAIAMTGYSAWLSYFMAIVLGFFVVCPLIFITSTIRMSGGYYSLIAAMVNEKVAGMFAVAQLTGMVSLSLFGVSLGQYVNSIFPVVNPLACGIALITFFYIVNLFGINIMAKAQQYMTWVLLTALLLFIVIGLVKRVNPIFDFAGEQFMTKGLNGLFMAMFLFSYSTNGYFMTMNYGRDAKNAKRDIPLAMLLTVPSIAIIYCGVAMVGSGILPIGEVAGKPLTLVAKNILSQPLFVFFIIGGPIMALTTTMNSNIPSLFIPVQRSCADGWFPKSFASVNRFGAPWKILTLIWILGLIPMLLKFNVNMITSNILLFNALKSFLYIYAYYRLPSKFPEAWKKSWLHVPTSLYYVIVTLSLFAQIALFIYSVRALTPTIAIVSIIVTIGCCAFGLIRSKSPDIKITASVWDN